MRHDDAAKEWSALGSWSLFPSAITYEPKSNSRIVQGERTGDGARQDGEADDGGVDTVEEAKGGSGQTLNGAAILVRQPGQLQVPAESR